MTDTERKEVELKTCPFCGNQPSISEAGHWAEVVIYCNCHAVPQVVQRCVSVPNEDGKTFHYDNDRAKREAIDIWNSRPQDNNPEEGETKNDIAWQQGYAAGKKANNALVPLDEEKLFEIISAHNTGNPDRFYNPKAMNEDRELALMICEKFGPKFGKDNSGMVPLDKKAITDSLGYPTNRLLTDKELSLINYICENFSQQPPKERKVSLEEFAKKLAHKDIPSKTWDDWSLNQQNWYIKEASEILSLLNATEEREGEE